MGRLHAIGNPWPWIISPSIVVLVVDSPLCDGSPISGRVRKLEGSSSDEVHDHARASKLARLDQLPHSEF
jgi:hypothetical protein